jgi:hypothetical protein
MRYKVRRVGAGVSVHTSRYTDVIHSFSLMAGALDVGKSASTKQPHSPSTPGELHSEPLTEFRT